MLFDIDSYNIIVAPVSACKVKMVIRLVIVLIIIIRRMVIRIVVILIVIIEL